MYENRRYYFFPAAPLDNVHFETVLENGPDTLRNSRDGKWTVLKFVGTTPNFIGHRPLMTHKDIRTELEGSAWQMEIN